MDNQINRDIADLSAIAAMIEKSCDALGQMSHSIIYYCNDCGSKMNSQKALTILDNILKDCDKISLYAQYGVDLASKMKTSCQLLEETDAIPLDINVEG